MHECRECDRATLPNPNKCNLCKRPYSCPGFEMSIADHGYFMEAHYRSICPSCASKIMRTMVLCEENNVPANCIPLKDGD